VFEKTCATTQKNVKSHVFGFKKRFKTFKKPTFSFTGHLIIQHSITQLPEVSTAKSQSPTSNISEVRTQETISN